MHECGLSGLEKGWALFTISFGRFLAEATSSLSTSMGSKEETGKDAVAEEVIPLFEEWLLEEEVMMRVLVLETPVR